jgi:hypothetical protein
MTTTPPTDVFDAIHNCRAMGRIASDPVDRATIEKLRDAANQGPSVGSRQSPTTVPSQRSTGSTSTCKRFPCTSELGA